MFIEIDVSAGGNCQESLMLMFNGLSEPAPAARVWTTDPGGADMMCAVTGWSSEGACPAYSAMVEESGEGSAVLVYGGDEGIRLKPLEQRRGVGPQQPQPVGRAVPPAAQGHHSRQPLRPAAIHHSHRHSSPLPSFPRTRKAIGRAARTPRSPIRHPPQHGRRPRDVRCCLWLVPFDLYQVLALARLR